MLPRISKELKNSIVFYTAEEFQRHWTGAIGEYQLQENEWLQCLFHERHMWLPACKALVFGWN